MERNTAGVLHVPFSMKDTDDYDPRARYGMGDEQGVLGIVALQSSRPLTSGASQPAAVRGSTAVSRAVTAAVQGTASRSQRTTFPIAVLIENRFRQVGIASIDMLRMYNIDLLQISDNQSYTQTMAFLQLLDPVDIVLCNSQHDRLLFKKIQDHFASEASGNQTQVSAIHRKFFDEVSGEQVMKALSSKPLGSLALGGDIGTSKYLALASLNALLKYIEHTQALSFAERSISFTLLEPAGRMAVDFETVKSLEVLYNARTGTAKGSLFDVINRTKTTVGAKLLRSNLLAPLVDITTLDTRLDCVEEVLGNESLYFGVVRALPKLLDLDRTLSSFVTAPKMASPKTCRSSIAGIIALKHTLTQVADVAESLNVAENSLLVAIRENLRHPKLAELAGQIDTVLTEDTTWAKNLAASQHQEIWSVKQGMDGNLDALRKVYSDCIAEIHEVVERYRVDWQCAGLKLLFNATRGHHLSFPASSPPLIYSNPAAYLQQLQQVHYPQHHAGMGMETGDGMATGFAGGGDDGTGRGSTGQSVASSGSSVATFTGPTALIQPVKFRNTISCTTEELFSLNERAKESLFNIYLMTTVITQRLTQTIRDNINALSKMTEAVALLDMLVSFASLILTAVAPAMGGGGAGGGSAMMGGGGVGGSGTSGGHDTSFTRPVFTEYGPIIVTKGRHLLLERAAMTSGGGGYSGGFGGYVPNDLYLGPGANLQILTGPNCSGKSTYLKQAATIVLLAHIGCFVPAQHAMIRITDRICTRIGTKDDLEANASTFLQEMKETAFIVEQTASQPVYDGSNSGGAGGLITIDGSAAGDASFLASIVRHNTGAGGNRGGTALGRSPAAAASARPPPRSLVLVDELGRGTSNEDGVGIAWSVAEHLLTNPHTHCIFITHYHELAELTALYGNARVTCMDVAAPSLAQLTADSASSSEALVPYQDTTSSTGSRPGTAAGGGINLPALQVQAAMAVRQPLSLSFKYSLKDGSSPHTSDYGIKLAEICGLPWPLIADAKMIKAKLVSRMRTRPLLLLGDSSSNNNTSGIAGGVSRPATAAQIAARISTAMTAAGGLSRIGTAAGHNGLGNDSSFLLTQPHSQPLSQQQVVLMSPPRAALPATPAGSNVSSVGAPGIAVAPDGCLLIECAKSLAEAALDDTDSDIRIRPNMRPATAAAITYGLSKPSSSSNKRTAAAAAASAVDDNGVTLAEALSLHAARTRLIANIIGKLAPLADPRAPINEHNESIARQIIQAIVDEARPQLEALGLTAESLAPACPPPLPTMPPSSAPATSSLMLIAPSTTAQQQAVARMAMPLTADATAAPAAHQQHQATAHPSAPQQAAAKVATDIDAAHSPGSRNKQHAQARRHRPSPGSHSGGGHDEEGSYASASGSGEQGLSVAPHSQARQSTTSAEEAMGSASASAVPRGGAGGAQSANSASGSASSAKRGRKKDSPGSRSREGAPGRTGGAAAEASPRNAGKRRRSPSPLFSLLLQHPYNKDASYDDIMGGVGKIQYHEQRKKFKALERQARAAEAAIALQERQAYEEEQAAMARIDALHEQLMTEEEPVSKKAPTPASASAPAEQKESSSSSSSAVGVAGEERDTTNTAERTTSTSTATAASTAPAEELSAVTASTPGSQASAAVTPAVPSIQKAGVDDFTVARAKHSWEDDLDGLL